jgi:CMP-N-acetylneuraminic acid synthetase
MKVGALIPCRKGSKGINLKNLKDLAGKRIWMWTMEAAIKSKICDLIVLSSDGGFANGDLGLVDPSDSKIVMDNERPEEYARDDSTSDEMLVYYARKYPEIDMWCLLQVTSPFRSYMDIRKAYKMAQNKKYDSIVSVTPNPCMFWIEKAVGIKDKDYAIATYHVYKRPMRQERKDWYMENGAVYFTPKYVLENLGNRLGGSIGLYKMPQERSMEIDTPFDWEIAEMLLSGTSKELMGKGKRVRNGLA